MSDIYSSVLLSFLLGILTILLVWLIVRASIKSLFAGIASLFSPIKSLFASIRGLAKPKPPMLASPPIARASTSSEVTPLIVLQHIRRINRWETAFFTEKSEFSFETHEGSDKLVKWLVNDKLMLVAWADIIAGFDLEKLNIENIKISKDKSMITIKLPSFEIFHATFNEEATRVVARNKAFFTGWFEDSREKSMNLERQARIEAKKQLQQAALEGGILQVAAQVGTYQLASHLQMLGFTQICIEAEGNVYVINSEERLIGREEAVPIQSPMPDAFLEGPS